MVRRKLWLRTDEYADVEGSLRKAEELVQRIEHNASEWKWLLIAVHSATQGMFVLALSSGNGLLTLKSSHAAAWLDAYENGGPWPKKLDLDYFMELYEKAKLRLPAMSVVAEHDNAMRRLNELRNGFIHFAAQGWSIQLAGLPEICRRCLDVAEKLGWQSESVFWRTRAQSQRAHRYLKATRRILTRLEQANKKANNPR